MSDIPTDFADTRIVRCFGGDHWVRAYATEEIVTINSDAEPFTHFWCLSCLKEVDELTKNAIARPSDLPKGLEPWDDSNPKGE